MWKAMGMESRDHYRERWRIKINISGGPNSVRAPEKKAWPVMTITTTAANIQTVNQSRGAPSDGPRYGAGSHKRVPGYDAR
jgi:hypothetical protein